MTKKKLLNERLGVRIRHLREQAGMSQEELGRKVNVTQQAVWNIEHGERRIKVADLGDWAHALGVTTTELIDGLGHTGEPISLTGGGKAGTKGQGERG